MVHEQALYVIVFFFASFDLLFLDLSFFFSFFSVCSLFTIIDYRHRGFIFMPRPLFVLYPPVKRVPVPQTICCTNDRSPEGGFFDIHFGTSPLLQSKTLFFPLDRAHSCALLLPFRLACSVCSLSLILLNKE